MRWLRVAVFVWATASAVARGQDSSDYGATARARPRASDGEAASRVGRRFLDERLVRSTPDALRYEPGVYVQQTAHGQASPFVRGLTGQQVVHLFDGIRMNNGIYRQGPNQYFFTVDSRSVRALRVIRGSASTRFGSDALGGALLALPVEPWADATGAAPPVRARLLGRLATADGERGTRAEVAAALGPRTAILVGSGFRDVGLLESGGVVEHLQAPGGTDRGAVAPWVPRFVEELEPGTDLDDWRTQLGTGFREGTFDARFVHEWGRNLRLVVALYGYRQSDAPRTDACPPREAPLSECLNIAKQFRTLTYAALRGDAGDLMRDFDLSISFQNHRERRDRLRPASFVRFDFEDNVDTLGLSFSASTRSFPMGAAGGWRLRYGGEVYRDRVGSEASQRFTDIDRELALSRGQYVDRSLYVQSGAFAEMEANPFRWLTLRGGGRVSFVGVRAPADPESGTREVRRGFGAVVGRIGGELRASREISFFLNLDQGFRAPNLDDVTSRQQTGPGFQFENSELKPERSLTTEVGVRADQAVIRAEAWLFATVLRDAIQRSPRQASDCPPFTPQCQASRNQFQLINADDPSIVWGGEGRITAHLSDDVALRTTLSYAWGEGPDLDGEGRVPLSRIPPLNGSVEARWRNLKSGLYASAAVRWALEQSRLAPTDESDARIPIGGTPGYVVGDLRAGWRHADRARLSLVFENVFDTAWRSHGSSVNGPGRGLLAEIMVGF